LYQSIRVIYEYLLQRDLVGEKSKHGKKRFTSGWGDRGAERRPARQKYNTEVMEFMICKKFEGVKENNLHGSQW
jgi:hypothetical protein